MSNPYEECLSGGQSDNALALAQCLSDSHEKLQQELNNNTSSSVINSPEISVPFTLYTASLVFFMQAGFAMVCAGSVRKKNVQNTTLKNLLDLCGAAISFFTVGYAIAFGDPENGADTTFIGTQNFFLAGIGDDETGVGYSNFIFQFSFAATAGK